MFERDQKEIGAYAQAGPDQMARVITFVYLTIQQSIFVVPQMLKDVDREGTESRHLWGFKLDAYEWLSDNRENAYRLVMDAFYSVGDPRLATNATLEAFASMPGLGVVKGGFCAQLVFGVSGCIDTHNLNIYGIKPSRFKASRYKQGSPRLKASIVNDYNDLCDEIGTDFLWDNWCGYVAKRNGTTADAVSRLHVEAVLN